MSQGMVAEGIEDERRRSMDGGRMLMKLQTGEWKRRTGVEKERRGQTTSNKQTTEKGGKRAHRSMKYNNCDRQKGMGEENGRVEGGRRLIFSHLASCSLLPLIPHRALAHGCKVRKRTTGVGHLQSLFFVLSSSASAPYKNGVDWALHHNCRTVHSFAP